MKRQYDLVVIGGGVVGLWTALQAVQSGLTVGLIERSNQLGAGTSRRNSGVLHSGLYYAPDSLKAHHCVRGRHLSLAFLREQGVPFSVCGKYIVPVATQEQSQQTITDSGYDALEQLRARALTNGVEDTEIVRPEQEFLHATWALQVRCTGIVDLPAYMTALEREVRRHGVDIYLNHACIAAERGTVHLRRDDTQREESLLAERIVNAAGLYADSVAQMFGLEGFEVRPNKGSYFRLRFPLPLQTLVYPLPSPDSGFLGVHYTPDLQGNAWVGPNSTGAADKTDFQPDADKIAFYKSLLKIIKGYSEEDLIGPNKVGLRARLFENEVAWSDFVIREHPQGVCHFLGIESPGLTAAPSLAKEALTRLGISPSTA